ncbi:MAG: type II toxin-antitoxin system VapC family toxin [Chitinophagaceae bacterium]|nr:type II toxin-antitoxin system VapC family toxin [Chitinophagaceae bacterium]
MAGTKFILDTNIIVAWLNGDRTIAEKVDKASAIFIPSIVAGELFWGAYNSGQVQKNLQKIKSLLQNYSVLVCDGNTALEYGRIKMDLKKKGNPIPENDIWIAALSAQYNFVLITRDAHFKNVKSVKARTW